MGRNKKSLCWWATQQHTVQYMYSIVTMLVWGESVLVMLAQMSSTHSKTTQKLYTSSLSPPPPSSYLFMTFSIFSTLPFLPPQLMHLFLSFSLSPWLCNLLFLLSPNKIKASPLFLFFGGGLFVDVLSISESRRVCAAEAVQNRNRESLCVCVTDVRYQ